MRNHPAIWESASRPLFVRTVWLEGSELRRGLQRHFLWDYDIRRPLERLNLNNNSLQVPKATDSTTLKRSISLELNEFIDFEDIKADEQEVFTVGSAKVKLHEADKLVPNKKLGLLKHRKRSSIFKQRCASYDSYHLDIPKVISRRNSDISEIQAVKEPLIHTEKLTNTAEELLAERVLHWLDLAGKEGFLKNFHQVQEMEVKLSKTCRLRQDAIKRHHNKIQNTQTSKNAKTKSFSRGTQASAEINIKPSESVKHITIIFNKEGQPIRLNRPPKNIDLCALSASPATTRRLAGTLASARLYKSAENSRCLNNLKASCPKPRNGNLSNKSISVHRRLDTVADLTNSSLQKRLREDSAAGGRYNLPDSKKQLHIFMPTLPKKGLDCSAYGTEDGISELSHNFNEMCKI